MPNPKFTASAIRESVTFNSDEAKRLADEFAEDDERAIVARWSLDVGPDADVILDGNGMSVCAVEHDPGSAAAIVRLRNNARSAATQLRAACEEVEKLRVQLATEAASSEQYAKERDLLRKDRDEWKGDRNMKDSLARMATACLQDVTADRDRLAAECERLNCKVDALEIDCDNWRQRARAAENALHIANVDLARQRRVIEERNAEIERLRSVADVLREKARNMEEYALTDAGARVGRDLCLGEANGYSEAADLVTTLTAAPKGEP